MADLLKYLTKLHGVPRAGRSAKSNDWLEALDATVRGSSLVLDQSRLAK